jgi:hypothetical protein
MDSLLVPVISHITRLKYITSKKQQKEHSHIIFNVALSKACYHLAWEEKGWVIVVTTVAKFI